VWHVVVAIAGDRIAKVVCKQCGGQHRYRPPDGAAASTSGRRRSTSGKTTSGKTTSKATGARKGTGRKQQDGPLVQADPARPVRSYGIAESFTTGDTIEHRTFGTGVVELELEDRKIQVYFPGGRRVLAHQRG
jgi:hypothetical protein